jgi:hypothetical protein
MDPKHPYFRALILAGLMGWTILEVSTNLSGPTKRTANFLPLPIPPMTSSAVSTKEARALHNLNPRMAGAYGHLPLTFEVNQGQTDPQVQFLFPWQRRHLLSDQDRGSAAISDCGFRIAESSVAD